MKLYHRKAAILMPIDEVVKAVEIVQVVRITNN
jgi:hypothetical protein